MRLLPPRPTAHLRHRWQTAPSARRLGRSEPAYRKRRTIRSTVKNHCHVHSRDLKRGKRGIGWHSATTKRLRVPRTLAFPRQEVMVCVHAFIWVGRAARHDV